MRMAKLEGMGGTGRLLQIAGVIVIVVLLAGSIAWYFGGDDEEERDFTGWYMAMSVRRFVNTSDKAINVTELLFTVDFGQLNKDDWVVQESNGFFLESDERWFPLRIEARYDDGEGPPEEFPILGAESEVTGSVRIKDDGLRLRLDGDQGLIDRGEPIDDYPHPYEASAVLSGENGFLTLYFNLNRPTM